MYAFEEANQHITNRLYGEYTRKEGIHILLKGSGLYARFSADGHLIISSDQFHGENMMNAKKNILAATVAFFSGVGGAQVGLAQEGVATDESGFELEEIVVTASRRETGLNDAAISVAAIGAEEISRRNLSEMNDYLRMIPGVSMVDLGVGRNSVVVRGLAINPQTTGETSDPTVGVYLGEVSIGGLGVWSGNSDLRMIDLERVEVLRGPQGTLFGSGALAGAVRNIPMAPNLQEFEGSIKTSYSNTAEEGGNNTKIEGVINVPIVEDVLAVRAVAYHHDTSGYIKNIAGTQLAEGGVLDKFGTTSTDAVATFGGAELYQNESVIGDTTYSGGRIAALWAPTDELNVTLQYVSQEVEQEGLPYVQLNTGGYTQVELQYGDNSPDLSGQGSGLEDEIDIINLVIDYDLGWASFLSSSAWLENEGLRNWDVTSFLIGSPAVQLFSTSADVFTQEFRLVSQLDGPLQYIAGLYYEDVERGGFKLDYATADVDLNLLGTPFGSGNPLLGVISQDRKKEQLAVYAELTYQLTEQLTLTGGARRFDYEVEDKISIDEGTPRNTISDAEEDGTSYKVNLSYQPTDETLIYAQWAEGFRLGIAVTPPDASLCDVNNDGLLDGTDTPLANDVESDTTENFEIGAKFTLLDSKLQINTAVYQVDWEGLPLLVFPSQLPSQPVPTCFSGVIANAGEARSQGVEIETTYQLSQDLRVSLGGAYTDVELTEVASGIPFSKGDRLPSSPDYNLNLGLQYEFEMKGYASYVQADYAYVSEFFSGAGETGDKAGDYGQLNLGAGITLDDFAVELFAHNLTNEDALTHVDVLLPDTRAYRLRPRTIGLNLTYQF